MISGLRDCDRARKLNISIYGNREYACVLTVMSALDRTDNDQYNTRVKRVNANITT